MNSTLRRVWRVLGCLLLLAPTACARSGPGCDSVIDGMRALGDAGVKVRYHRSLVELLPNTKFQVGRLAPRALAESVVVGRFVSVDRGRAHFTPGDEAPRTSEEEFEDRRVMWRTVHGELEVEQTIAGQKLDRVTVGLSFLAAPSFRVIERCLPNFGRVLLFLRKSGAFDYDPNVYGTVDDGSLLGLVSDDGRITLPVADDPEGRLLDGGATIAQLTEAAKRPNRVIQVDGSGQRVK